ncbi:hypothetical protein [Cereibacter sediminicola]|uniref:hypothetical protein n=1 Tax=Cereibacter sediminicola TaxID=2584941 RepID=UPI00119E328D|nr:hypothetical protein [Cereibacter sediminicola]
MSILDVHLLVGDPSLLTPDLVHGQDLAALFETELRCVPAYWLSLKCGRYSHNFLADDTEDNRIEVFARSLVTDYVRGPRPFLIIPGLIDEPSAVALTDRKDWGTVLVALAHAIRALGVDCIFYLHLLTIPFASETMTRLERLRNWLEGLGLNARIAEDAIVRVASGMQHSARLERNYLSEQLSATVAKRCEHSGLAVSDMDLLKIFSGQCLERLARTGLRPGVPLDDVLLDRLVDAVIAQAMGSVLPASAGQKRK